MRIISWFAMVCFLLEFNVLSLLGTLGTVELFVHAAVRIIPSQEKWPTQGRPILLPQRYTQAQTEAVQPPDDRTYSAEVTVFQRNLLHHRITRIVSLHTLDYDTTKITVCQAQF